MVSERRGRTRALGYQAGTLTTFAALRSGHARISITLDTYTHLFNRRKHASRLATAWKPGTGTFWLGNATGNAESIPPRFPRLPSRWPKWLN
jgi:hypothetical protein